MHLRSIPVIGLCVVISATICIHARQQKNVSAEEKVSSNKSTDAEIQRLDAEVKERRKIADAWDTWNIRAVGLAGLAAALLLITAIGVSNSNRKLLSFSEQLEKAKDRELQADLKSKEDEIANANARASEANQKAEEERLARLKIEERLAPRSLTAEQIHLLQTKLRQYTGQPVQISYLIGDVESQVYAAEFGQALGSAGWAVSPGLPSMFNFAGLAVRVQDPTSVPEAAEALAKTIEAMGITVQRIHTSNKVEISGNRPSIGFDLWVSKKGGATLFARSSAPLQLPRIGEVAAKGDLVAMSNEELVAVTREVAHAMREFEATNQEQLGNEWRVDNQPLAPGSYREVFEQYRARAIRIRDELLKRTHGDKATTLALDAETLAGVSPITDAANYLDSLADRVLRSPK
jgi:hypothetical protein